MAFAAEFDPTYGRAVELRPGIRRLTARNASLYTYRGTNSYLIGSRELAVVDPGPADPRQLDDIMAAAGSAPIRFVIVTHPHRDHSPGAAALVARTCATLCGPGAYALSRPLHPGEVNGMASSGDPAYRPARRLLDGDIVRVDGLAIEAVATPGHTAEHLCLAISGSDLLLSGDHVMGWSTSIVAPPDGRMRDYMASLDRLAALSQTTYLPGHGDMVTDGHGRLEELKAHRQAREASLLARLGPAPQTIDAMVGAIYADISPSLRRAASLSMFAQLEWLVERGLVGCDGPPLITSGYRLV